MKTYYDTSTRVDELLDAYALVYCVPGTEMRYLNAKHVRFVSDPNYATWFVGRTDLPEFESSAAAFSACDGIANFVLAGPHPSNLPDTFEVTAIEQYANGDYLTIGKRVA